MIGKSETRAFNKHKAFKEYKDKWNLNGYKFFSYQCTYPRILTVYVINENYHEYRINDFTEILSLKTFLKRLKESGKIALWESRTDKSKFDSVEEFKQYMLIRKIAGI